MFASNEKEIFLLSEGTLYYGGSLSIIAKAQLLIPLPPTTDGRDKKSRGKLKYQL